MSKSKKKKKKGTKKKSQVSSMIEENRSSPKNGKAWAGPERKPTKKEKKLKSVRLFRRLKSLRYVTLMVEDQPKRFDLHDEICLTPDDVSSNFYIEAEQFLTFRSLLSIARSKLSEARDEYALQFASAELAWRQDAEAKSDHRDGFYFKRKAETNSVVLECQKEVRRWEREVDLLDAIVSGLEIKKHMVISASAQDRNHNRYLNREED